MFLTLGPSPPAPAKFHVSERGWRAALDPKYEPKTAIDYCVRAIANDNGEYGDCWPLYALQTLL